MTDTVTLLLEHKDFYLMDLRAFSPSAEGLFKPLGGGGYSFGSRGYITCVQNHPKSKREQGEYRPFLTLTKRMYGGGAQYPITLKIQFSVPKLLYLNNYNEIVQNDFERIVDALHTALLSMSVKVLKTKLRTAVVMGIHFSKNIILDNHTTCSMIIRQINKINMSQRLQMTQSLYSNGGLALRYHAKNHEFIVYDKIKEMEQESKGKKKSKSANNGKQLRLLAPTEHQLPNNVLRLEYRLNTPRKIEGVLKKIGAPLDRSFCNMIKKEISQKALLSFWEPMEKELRALSYDENDTGNLLDAIQRTRPNIRPIKMLQLCGALLLNKSIGAHQLRDVMGLVGKKSASWYKLVREMRNISAQKDHFLPFLEVSKGLSTFKETRLIHRPVRSINAYYQH